MAMDPEATVIAPSAIKRIFVIRRSRDRPELPLSFFILPANILKISLNFRAFFKLKIITIFWILAPKEKYHLFAK